MSEAKAPEREERKSFWEKLGFVRELANLCENLEGEQEQNILSPASRHFIDTMRNAKSTKDLAGKSTSELQQQFNQLRQELDRHNNELNSFSSSIGRARTIAVDVDFI